MDHTSTGRSDKNRRIADSMRATYAKREGQVCRVFQCKIQRNKLTAGQKEELKMLFVEGKWCYNAILNSGESPSLIMTRNQRLLSIRTRMATTSNVSMPIFPSH